MNRSFLLVAIIFAILSAINSISGSFQMFNPDAYMVSIPGATPETIALIEPFLQFIGIIMIIFGILNIFAAVRINAARNGKATAKEALGWSIYLLFTTWIIGGIFGILGSKESGQNATPIAQQSASLETRLKEIDDLFTKGLISKEEYQTRRAKLIDKV